MPFYALQVSFAKTYYTFAEKPDEILGKTEGENFYNCGVMTGTLGEWELLSVGCANFLSVSAGSVYENLKEWIRCLYNKVIDRLFVVKY